MTIRAALLALSLAAPAAPATADPVVVELFTSQGCSACPPADAMLAGLAGRDDVIALAFHVDYWDWIGWTDTFGDAAHSERQRRYAAAADTTIVYTPQFVIGGHDAIAGPKGMDLMGAIEAHQGATPDLLRADGAGFAVADGAGGRLTLLFVQPEAEVAIGQGENGGRVMRYHRIVRAMRDLGAWDGRAGRMDLPPPPEGLRRVVLAQAEGEDGGLGRVLGAVALD